MKTAVVFAVLGMVALSAAQPVLVVEKHFGNLDKPSALVDSMMEDAMDDFKRVSDQMDRDMERMENQLNEEMSRTFLRREPVVREAPTPNFQVEIEIQRPRVRQFNVPNLFRSLFALGDKLNQQGSLAPMQFQQVDLPEQQPEQIDAVPMETMTEAEPMEIEFPDLSQTETESAPDMSEVEVTEVEPEETVEENAETEDTDEVEVVAETTSASDVPSTSRKPIDEKKRELTVFILSGVGAFVIVTGLAIFAVRKHVLSAADDSIEAEDALDREPILPEGVDSEIADHIEGRPYSPPNL